MNRRKRTDLAPTLFLALLFIPILLNKSYAEGSPQAPFNRGVEWLQQEDLNAEADVRDILKSDPDNPDAYFNLGMTFLSKRRPDLALLVLNRAVELRPDFVEAHVRLGEIYEGQGNQREAVREYEEAYLYMDDEDTSGGSRILARIESLENAMALREKLQQGVALSRRGNYQEAEAAFREVIALQSDHAQAYNFLGIVLGIQDRLDEAIESFKRSLLISPGFLDSRNRLVELYQVKGELTAARSELEKAILFLEEKNGPEAELLEARLNAIEDQIEMKAIFDRISKDIEEKNFDSAMIALQSVLRRDPKQVTANFIIGNLWADRQRYDLAETSFKTVIEESPNSPDGYLRLAQVYERTGFFGRAKSQYEKVLLTPAGREGGLRQQIQEAVIRLEEGRKQLQRASQEAAAEGRRALQEGDPEKAVLFLSRATQMMPEDSGLHFELGELYERSGKIDPAINQMRGAIEFDPTLEAAYLKLGLLYEKKRNFYQAGREIDRSPAGAPQEILSRIEKQIAEVERETSPLTEKAKREEEEERISAAIKTLRNALAIAPDDLQLRMHLGELYAKAGLGVEAFNEFNTVLGGDPGNGEAEYRLGRLYASARQWVDARPKYELALQSKKLPAELREKAAAELEWVKDKIKDDETIRRYTERGGRQLAEEDFLAAAESFSKVNALSPDDVLSLYRTGVAYEGLKKWEEAARYYQEVLSRRPTNVLAHQRLGFVYETLGRNEEAIRTYRNGLAQASDQESPEAQAIKDRLIPLEDRISVSINQVVVGYESNPNQEATPSAGTLTSSLNLTLTYHFMKDPRLNIPIELSTRNIFYFRANTFFSTETLSVSLNSLRLPFSYSFGYRLSMGVSDNGGILNFDNVGFLNLERRVGDFNLIGLGYTYDYFYSRRRASEDAIRQNVRIFFDQNWDINTLSFAYSFSDNNYGFQDQTYQSHGASVAYRTTLFEVIRASVSYSLEWKNFSNPDTLNSRIPNEETSDPNDVILRPVFRRNLLHSFSLNGLYFVRPNFSLSVGYLELLNLSNLPAAFGADPVSRLSGQAESLGDFRDRIVSFSLNWNF